MKRIEANPRETWDEEDGYCLWWKFPVVEPPHVGDMRDYDFPDDVTHWTPIEVPDAPNDTEKENEHGQ